jgi:hypothetical protein
MTPLQPFERGNGICHFLDSALRSSCAHFTRAHRGRRAFLFQLSSRAIVSPMSVRSAVEKLGNWRRLSWLVTHAKQQLIDLVTGAVLVLLAAVPWLVGTVFLWPSSSAAKAPSAAAPAVTVAHFPWGLFLLLLLLFFAYVVIFTATVNWLADEHFELDPQWTLEYSTSATTTAHVAAAITAAREANVDKAAREQNAGRVLEQELEAVLKEADASSSFAERLGLLGKAVEWSEKHTEFRFKRMSYMLDRLQSRIDGEYSDLAARTAWLLSGLAFMLGAFVAILNSDHLTMESRRSLAAAVACAGSVVSFLLMVSAFFAYTLVNALKIPRGLLETRMESECKTVPAGVTPESPTHRLAHAATRLLPSFAYVAWIALALLTLMTDVFAERAKPVPDAGNHQVQVGGLARLEPSSPAFPIGKAAYVPTPGCSDQSQKAELWVDQVVGAWLQRKTPSTSDWLVLVGSADPLGLNGPLKTKLDSNMALARQRADEIKRRLEERTKALTPTHAISDQRVLVLVTGPRAMLIPGKPRCDDLTLAEDRRVEVWLPARN